jgi:hypothetical protein
MRHADALSRNIGGVETAVVLSKETVRDKQEVDDLCKQYRQYENFWVDKDGVLYRQGNKGQPSNSNNIDPRDFEILS